MKLERYFAFSMCVDDDDTASSDLCVGAAKKRLVRSSAAAVDKIIGTRCTVCARGLINMLFATPEWGRRVQKCATTSFRRIFAPRNHWNWSGYNIFSCDTNNVTVLELLRVIIFFRTENSVNRFKLIFFLILISLLLSKKDRNII